MKTIILILCVFCCTLSGYSQNNSSERSLNIDKASVTEPLFAGVKLLQSTEKCEKELLKKHLEKRLEYPIDAKRCRSQGTGVIEFVVSKDGTVNNFRIINSVCPSIDDEMVRLLKTTDGMWQPAVKDGMPVDRKKQVSMIFAMCDDRNSAICSFKKYATFYGKRANKQMLIKGNLEKAEKLYSEAIVYLPFDESLLLLRGICRYELGNTEGALEDVARLKELAGMDEAIACLPEMIKGIQGYRQLLAATH